MAPVVAVVATMLAAVVNFLLLVVTVIIRLGLALLIGEAAPREVKIEEADGFSDRNSEGAKDSMEWRLLIEEPEMSVLDEDLSLVARGALQFLACQAGPLDLRFSLQLSEDPFQWAASPDASGLGNAVRDGFLSSASQRN